ncbi:MAG TPA: tetratricopeptide repeat protein, partial [Bacillota bacterium]|nr:tetratricopeptide repeat protein [Bacillota bacterium]
GPNGNTDYIRDEQGNVVKSHLNERLLQEIAGATEGGFYLPLRGAKTIDTLYTEGLAKLPKSEHQEKLVKQYHERFHWPLLAAILLLLAEMIVPERPRQPRTRSKPSAPAQPALQHPALPLLLLLALPASLRGSPSSALRDYKAGQYEQALGEYEKLLQKKSDDPRLHFNAGAAAYRHRQFEAAAKHFNDALASPNLKLQEQAYYNRGNALYWLGESAADPAKRSESWEKALKDFESTLKLNQQDPDAKFNHEFVKKRLEELKQQQQQQSQQNKSDQQKNQDQQQQQQNQQNDQSKQDQNQQQQQQPAQQNQSQQKQNSSQQQDQQRQQNQPQQAGDPAKGQKDKPQQPQSAQAAKPSEQKEKPGAQDEAAAAEAAGEMTPEQAQQLLDAQKGEEKLLPPQVQGKPVDRRQALKDW